MIYRKRVISQIFLDYVRIIEQVRHGIFQVNCRQFDHADICYKVWIFNSNKYDKVMEKKVHADICYKVWIFNSNKYDKVMEKKSEVQTKN